MSNYNIQVSVPPTTEPVSAEELHEHLSLNVALNAVEDLLNVYITAAREQFETMTDGRIVNETVFTQHMTCFPHCPDEPVKLYRGDVLSVDSITYYDADDELQTLEDYETDLTGIPALITKSDGFPSVSTTKLKPITITFTAGFLQDSAHDVPQSVRLAILLLAAHYYTTREAFGEVDLKEVPMGFKHLCAKWKTGLGGL